MKKYKIINFLIIILIGLFLPIYAYSCELYVHTNGGDLNGRIKPDKHSPIESKFGNNDKVEAIDIQGNWIKVLGGETGIVWCSAKYLSEVSERELYYINTSGGRVFIRNTISGEKIGYVNDNKTICVTNVINNWGYIGNGWIDLSFFTLKGDIL